MLRTAVIARRTDTNDADLTELRRLTEAAGARVVAELAQTRPADPGTELGAGKVEEVADVVAETGADTVVVDGELTPGQTVTLEDAIGATVIDRKRVVLEIFAEQAESPRAQTQAELARLRYRLPRVRERADEGALNRRTESGTPYYDLLDRIDELERSLAERPAVSKRHREQRASAGLPLVAIAGYTNAGKSTLLRRLADDMAVETDSHQDLDETATTADRLFETLETTTRRATIDGRPALLTDTVGFLDDLPHWLVESFRSTLGAVEGADAVVLVAAVDQPVDELQRRLSVVHNTIGDLDVPTVTVLNKADRVAPDTLARRCETVESLVPNPVTASVRDGSVDAVTEAINTALPALTTETFKLPLTDDAMSLVSWLHDEAIEIDVEYTTTTAVVTIEAPAATIGRARSRVSGLDASTATQ